MTRNIACEVEMKGVDLQFVSFYLSTAQQHESEPYTQRKAGSCISGLIKLNRENRDNA